MDLVRNELKVRLFHLRGRCDVCGGPLALDVCGGFLAFGVDMHESIVSKQQVRGWKKELRGLINVEENCHLVHHGDCHDDTSPRLMVAIQIVRYGKARIQTWVDRLPFKVKYYWDRGLTEASARYVVEVFAPWILEEE